VTASRLSLGNRLTRAVARPPYHDETGHKGWLESFSRAQPHAVRHLSLKLPGWRAPALRIAFLSDFHLGSHAGDAARLAAMVSEAANFKPDIALYGGDFVNMQWFGGGRIPPRTIAAILGRLDAPLGRFAVLGNHDYTYGSDEVARSLEANGIAVLSDVRHAFGERGFDVLGLPDAREVRSEGMALVSALTPDRPAIVLAHDPFWFAHVPAGPHLTLAGHTHGGQVSFPLVGPLRNASSAPMRWTYGHVVEDGRHLYVTSGIGTSGIPLRVGVLPEFAIIDVGGDHQP
jgi:predicted MPP superfamily phosphohydrolase